MSKCLPPMQDYGTLPNDEHREDETNALIQSKEVTASTFAADHHPSRPPKNRFAVALAAGCIAAAAAILATFAHSDTMPSQESGPTLNNVAATLAQPPTLFKGSSSKVEEPNEIGPLYFDQLVNPLDEQDNANRTWKNTYFVSDTYFQGPGHPLFVILGGEGPETGIAYAYVTKGLAKRFGGMTVQTEHRFYGASQPMGDNEATTDDLIRYFKPEMALLDWARLIRHLQTERGCVLDDKHSPKYCPVVTIGGSYPGFMSAVFRLIYPDVVDIGYASGAPLILNAQHLDQLDLNAYFTKVTQVAEAAFPGCADGVYSTLKEVNSKLMDPSAHRDFYESYSQALGICAETIPPYMRSNSVFGTEMTQIVASVAADMNMFFRGKHPENSLLVSFCTVFTDKENFPSATDRFKNYLALLMTDADYIDSNPISYECYDLNSVLPYGANATISCADWTGCGPGISGQRWEFQICQDLIMPTGFGKGTMFYPPRNWTLEWLSDHCESRFGVRPVPGRLNDMWHFDNLTDTNRASNILFVNGEKDGWLVGSFTSPPNPLIEIVTMPNGAHHSELAGEYPRWDDTPDVLEAQDRIEDIIGDWLKDIRN
jgi:pimeloyl-ACP methyl ester carboxylesterase